MMERLVMAREGKVDDRRLLGGEWQLVAVPSCLHRRKGLVENALACSPTLSEAV